MLSIRVVLVLLLLLIFARAQRLGAWGESFFLSDNSLANEASGEKREVRIFTLVRKDGIRSIDDPSFLTPDQAGGQMAEDDQIIGLVRNGEARA